GRKLLGLPVLTVIGFLAFLAAGTMCYILLTHESLGLAFSKDNPAPYLLIFGAVVVAAIIYFIGKAMKARQGVNVECALREVPPEGRLPWRQGPPRVWHRRRAAAWDTPPSPSTRW